MNDAPASGPTHGEHGDAALQTSKNGTALAALIVGVGSILTIPLCGLGAVVGLVAIILGIVGLASIDSTRVPPRGGRGLAITGLLTGIVGMLGSLLIVPAIMLPALVAARETAQRLQAQTIHRQISIELTAAALDGSGVENLSAQDALDEVVRRGGLQAGWEASYAAPTPGTPLLYVVPGHIEGDPGLIVLFDNPRNWDGEGGIVTYADGRTEWVDEPAFSTLIDGMTMTDGAPPPHLR